MAEFDLTPKQALAWIILRDKKTTELGYGGGAGGGKSILGCFWLLNMCIEYPGTAWLMGRKELTNLKKTTLISFFLVLKILKINPDDLFKINFQTNTIEFHNGSIIFMMDTAYKPSDPLNTRFGSLELTGGFLDESNENPSGIITIIKTRLGRRMNKEYGLKPKLLETFNPSKDHVYYHYYRPYRDKNLPLHRKFIPALATDNPYLDPSYIEQLKNADKITRERLLYGNFEYEDDPTSLFDYDKIIQMFNNEYEARTAHQRYLSVDVARFGDDRTVIIQWLHLHIEKIYYMEKKNTKEVAELIKRISYHERIPVGNIIIDDDGLGGGVVDQVIGCKGFVNNSRAIERKTPINKAYHMPNIQNFANLKTQCYFTLSEYVNEGKISVFKEVSDDNKERIIDDLQQIKVKDPDKDQKMRIISKEEIKEHLGRSPDYSDAMMMRMYFELKVTYKPYIAK